MQGYPGKFDTLTEVDGTPVTPLVLSISGAGTELQNITYTLGSEEKAKLIVVEATRAVMLVRKATDLPGNAGDGDDADSDGGDDGDESRAQRLSDRVSAFLNIGAMCGLVGAALL